MLTSTDVNGDVIIMITEFDTNQVDETTATLPACACAKVETDSILYRHIPDAA